VSASADECRACAPGFYPTDDRTQCVACRAGSHSEVGGNGVADCVCNAGFSGRNGGVCVLCAAGKFRDSIFGFDWARSCGAASNTGCAAAQSSGADGDANAVWTPQSCTHTSNAGVNWWSVVLRATPIAVSGLRVRGRAQGTGGYSVYIGNDMTAAGMITKNTLCVAGVAGAAVEQFGPVDLVCEREISGRIVVFAAADSHLTLCDVQIWSPDCAPCPANSVSLPGSDERTDCHCNAGWSGVDVCVQCVAGKYSNGSVAGKYSNGRQNLARSCGAAGNAACPTAQTSTAYGGVAQRAVDGDSNPVWNGSSCTHTQNTGVNWWSVTLGEDPVVIEGLRIRGIQDDRLLSRSKGYSVYVGNDTTAAGMFENNVVCVPATAGRGLQLMSADDLVCEQPIVGRIVVVMVPNDWLTLCEVEVWSATSAPCWPCPPHTGSAAGSGGCVCSPGWTWSDTAQCVPCEAATYKPTLGSEQCLPCPANSSSLAMSTLLSACQCNVGWYHADGAVCEMCAPGKYVKDSLSCVNCEAGKYGTTVNAVSCMDCPPDTGSVGVGAIRCGCLPGFTGDSCEACAGDTYKDFFGYETCTACPASSSTASSKNTAVSDCKCSTDRYRVAVPD